MLSLWLLYSAIIYFITCKIHNSGDEDGILLAGVNEEDHEQTLVRVFDRLQEAGFRLSVISRRKVFNTSVM